MNAPPSAFTIVYFGKPRSFASEAALLARDQVSAHLAKTQGIEVKPDEIRVAHEPRQEGLSGVVKARRNAFVVVPLSNSKLGDVYDFMPFYTYQMLGEVAVNVVFVLCNLSGNAADIKSIVTKNTAYEQVVDTLDARGFDRRLGRPDDRSTSEAAEKASQDPTVAAVCSPAACTSYGLRQVGETLNKYVTTFGIFWNEPRPYRMTDSARAQFSLLMRNADLYSGRVQGGGKAELVERLDSKGVLRVKWGIDPLSSSLHLGHLACLHKLGHFLAFGHEVVVVLGTLTGRVGDPSGNLTARPRLDVAELEINAENLKRQIECVLGPGRVKFESNGKLVEGLDLEKLLRWGYGIDYRLLVGRTDFQARLRSERSLSLAEILYGLFQAHDTAVLDIDVEVGGLDQLHNCILMRDVLKLEARRRPPLALLIPLLPGIDGDAKMSIFRGNHIAVTDSREDIRLKLLSIRRPGHVYEYLRGLTDVEEHAIAEFETAFEDGNLSIDDLVNAMADAVLEKLDAGLEGMVA